MRLNPVLGREIKERMRSRRAAIIVVGFLSLLAAILYLVYRTGQFALEQSGPFNFTGSSSASLGRLMFEWLMVFLLLFVAFIAPGIAAGGVVGERERRTMHPLQVTLLTPRNIVLGKLGASLAFVTLLVVSTAPLFAISLVLGGVTPWQVVRGLIVVLAVEMMLAASATYISARAKRTLFATVASYAISLALVVGTLLVFGAEMLWRSYRGESFERDSVAIYLNPVAALGDAAGDAAGPGNLPNPLSGLAMFIDQQLYEGDEFVRVDVDEVVRVGPGEQRLDLGPPERAGPPLIRLWMVHVALLLGVSALSLYGATRRVRAPVARLPKVREASA
ncbi:MAG: ABC transporter permease [Actinomycetota bacterium]